MKRKFVKLSLASLIMFAIANAAYAGDDGSQAYSSIGVAAAPIPGVGEYLTNLDNENNAGTGVADGDMDTYLYNTSSNHPVEFNINIPVSVAGRNGTLRMDVYDIDAAQGEIDKVYVNGKYVGTLNGRDGIWGVNIFDIPSGVLKTGKNKVRVDIDVKNKGNWATNIDWGMISLSKATTVSIDRGWVSPVRVKRGGYVNLFAEVSGPDIKGEQSSSEVGDGAGGGFD
ncbi:hypothetical protein [Candidatus Thiothrix anitrata]|uniref:Uncharacterized protein n=1 Tax=Candidatus Thiothrix anitrata TaxID=2823902 RepID=A0ABX7X354_9GAMM|nr:hypothetical protein [Candidatus Thiothrix anitrata]QTR50335.1 hypothetical protein J8380_01745 [Candidatus Thiothrix anitrata]